MAAPQNALRAESSGRRQQEHGREDDTAQAPAVVSAKVGLLISVIFADTDKLLQVCAFELHWSFFEAAAPDKISRTVRLAISAQVERPHDYVPPISLTK